MSRSAISNVVTSRIASKLTGVPARLLLVGLFLLLALGLGADSATAANDCLFQCDG